LNSASFLAGAASEELPFAFELADWTKCFEIDLFFVNSTLFITVFPFTLGFL
jgi:hypothetical protein